MRTSYWSSIIGVLVFILITVAIKSWIKNQSHSGATEVSQSHSDTFEDYSLVYCNYNGEILSSNEAGSFD
jgi:hypothetical protein